MEKKTIMVFDVPAVHGGALTVLEQQYEKAKQNSDKNWIFILSKAELSETNNIKVLKYPWIKKSWAHRLYFDYFIAHKLVKKYKADEVLSLQNIGVPFIKIPQSVYVHQSIPFIDIRFSLRNNGKLWIYQNVIGKLIFISIRKANEIIVQTEWMKKATVQKAGIEKNKVTIDPPQIKVETDQLFVPSEKSLCTFFYPANGHSYKNHKIIVESSKFLKGRGITNYKIYFTLEGDESSHVKELFAKVKVEGLPIAFMGALTKDEVFDYYTKSVLLFPSYVETFGLPMLEARQHETPILASDMPFTHEILDGYDKVKYFSPTDAEKLVDYMEESIMFANKQI